MPLTMLMTILSCTRLQTFFFLFFHNASYIRMTMVYNICISLEFIIVWVFFGLYGPCNSKEKRELWEELAVVKGLWGDPWCIAGDFNVVRFPVEKNNGRQMSTTMRDFSGFIEEFELVDPPLGGGTFTWSGGE